jgi:hypothetical protein
VKTAVKVILFLVLLLSLPALAYLGLGLLSGNAVDGRIADLREAGAPTSWSDLQVEMPPEEDNGAALLDEAIEVLKSMPMSGGPKDFLTNVDWRWWKVEDLGTARALLDQMAEPIALVEEALARPQIVFQVPDDPMDNVTPSLLGCRDVLNLWLSRARVHRLEGEREVASQELAEALRLARAMGATSLLGLMIRVSMVAMVLEEIQASLHDDPAGLAGMRATLDPQLAMEDDPRLLVRAFEQERVFGLEMQRRILAGEDIDGATGSMPGWLVGPFVRVNMESYLELMASFVEVARLSYSAGHEQSRVLEQELQDLGMMHVLTKMMLPALLKVYETMAKQRARVRMARVAMAACEVREASGAWPAELQSLVPMIGEATILDTLNDQPFVIERPSSGLRLRSAWIAAGSGDAEEVARSTWDLGVPAGEEPR